MCNYERKATKAPLKKKSFRLMILNCGADLCAEPRSRFLLYEYFAGLMVMTVDRVLSTEYTDNRIYNMDYNHWKQVLIIVIAATCVSLRIFNQKLSLFVLDKYECS